MPAKSVSGGHPAAYPLQAVRALALNTQGLDIPLGQEGPPTLGSIYRVVERLGCVQIDTLQMVHRSQYLVLWSRLGHYKPGDFDRLIYDPQHRRLFEYWKHAASIIPLAEYRYHLPMMRYYKEGHGVWWENWLHQPGNAELVEAVRQRIQKEGGVRASDFVHDGGPRGTWWDWKPAKHALEHLYNTGELMIASRINFQRIYDLRERVLPEWVDTTEPTVDERNRHRIEQAVRALGICEPFQASEYAYLKRGTSKPYVEELIAEGVFVEVQAVLADGVARTLIVHRLNLPLLERAAAGDLPARRTTFLSPFDNLFWARQRDELFWGFRNVLEAYKPASDRIWGYYSIPVLHDDRFVGRFDPRLDRKSGTLYLKAIYLEPGVDPTEDLASSIAATLRDFLEFHTATDLVVERSHPAEFGEKLLAFL